MATILVVEDNEMLQVMVARWLKRRGHQVCVAGDGAQGLALAHSEQPDVILMDMNIPLLDGWTLTRTLKAAAPTQRIPIIGLSADALADDQARGLAAGCVAYYTKPIDFPPLLDYIDRLDNQPAPDNAGHRPARQLWRPLPCPPFRNAPTMPTPRAAAGGRCCRRGGCRYLISRAALVFTGLPAVRIAGRPNTPLAWLTQAVRARP